MHFRPRKNAIQVIRTTYDPATKKGRSEIVGRIPKASLEVPAALQKACRADELAEVSSWVAEYAGYQRLRQEYAAKSLPEQLALAREWFELAAAEPSRPLAAAIQREWAVLRAQLKKRGIVD
jgi:hypothetical protein